MRYAEVVRGAAKTLGLLDEQGALKPLDSLAMVDLVQELETLSKLSIPSASMRVDTFTSLESIGEMLEEIA